MDNKFFTFIKPYLAFIDSGQFYRNPFSWVYTIIAILNILFPIYLFYTAVDGGIFEKPAKFMVTFLLIWLAVAFASWLSFQLWWDRRTKVISTTVAGDDFVATPVFSHFIQTMGEWLGTWIGIVGFAVALFTTLLLGNEGYFFSARIGVPFVQSGLLNIVIMPIYGFFIIVFTRFLAEQFRALASIANNTKKS